MTPAALSLIAAGLLLSPWLCRPLAVRPKAEMHGVLLVLWWLNRLYCTAFHRVELDESDFIPKEGGVLLVSNHTSGVDHMILQAMTRRALGFLIAQELYDWKLGKPFCRLIGCIPVRRDGRDLAATRASLRALKEGRVVPIFPEGRIVPHGGRVIEEGKPGAAYIALRGGVPVVPAYISGTPESNEFLVSVRIPSESRIVFGPPVELDDLRGGDERAALDEATRRIMAAIRALRDQQGIVGEEATVEREPEPALQG